MRPLWRGASALLGLFVGCGQFQDVPEYGAPVPMYGVPDTGWRQYDLSGVVLDAETESPIQGIQVAFEGEADRTEADGRWGLVADYPCDPPCMLTADDVDGTANGSYQPLEVEWDPEVQWDSDIVLELEPQ